MTDKLISCPACNSDNLDNSVYCCQCGLPMREGIPPRRRKSHWLSIILLSLVLSSLMTVALQLFDSGSRTGYSPENSNRAVPALPAAPQEKALPQADSDEQKITSESSNSPSAAAGKSSAIHPLPVGHVAIITPEGNLIAQIPAAVVGGSWLALPFRLCLGGDKWLFRIGDGREVAIAGGLWEWGDAVGMWQLQDAESFSAPAFATWQSDMPVRLQLFATGRLTDEMLLKSERTEGIFSYCPLPDPTGPGVFLQNGRVVGWCFGEMLEGAYMWTLSSDDDIQHDITVEDFYNVTFAGGREDFFARALAIRSDTPPQVLLQMFTEAFWYPPKLSAADTPRFLRPQTLYPYIVQLVAYIMNQELFNDIALLADEPLFREIRSQKLLMNVAVAIQKIYGFEAAVNFIEGPGADIVQSDDKADPHLEKLHADLYATWLTSLLENGDTLRGWQVFNRARDRFRESLEIHLLGVELALAEGDWSEAETLLYQKKYPLAFRERMMLLANRISSIKGKENQIIITFQPGSQEIPVTATINALLDQDFLIDTGSSYVTIPTSTVQALGLEYQVSERQQEVQTAGGTVYANVVFLPAIELQGWVVNDVRALVLDLPNRPGVGLLGLNFLDRFRMDLQTDNGTLILEPQ